MAIHTGTACLDDSIAKNIVVEKLNIQALADATVDEGKSFQLNVTGGGSHFLWSPVTWLSNPGIANPVTTPYGDVVYKVSMVNDAGCTATDSIFIKVNAINDIYVPSAFTPNHDNLNDVLKPYMGIQFTLQSFDIYNRWGRLIFRTGNKGEGWDGTINSVPQSNGVYVWILKAQGMDGKPLTRRTRGGQL